MNAEEFKKLEEAIGLSQRELAEQLGYTREMINAYSTGRAPIPKSVDYALRWLSIRAVKGRRDFL